jgi:hypothetical protein
VVLGVGAEAVVAALFDGVGCSFDGTGGGCVSGGVAAGLAASVAAAPASRVAVGSTAGAYVVPSGRLGASHGDPAPPVDCAAAIADHHETSTPIHNANSRFTA